MFETDCQVWQNRWKQILEPLVVVMYCFSLRILQGHISVTGDRRFPSTTGDRRFPSTTGDRRFASTTGDWRFASTVFLHCRSSKCRASRVDCSRNVIKPYILLWGCISWTVDPRRYSYARIFLYSYTCIFLYSYTRILSYLVYDRSVGQILFPRHYYRCISTSIWIKVIQYASICVLTVHEMW